MNPLKCAIYTAIFLDSFGSVEESKPMDVLREAVNFTEADIHRMQEIGLEKFLEEKGETKCT